MEPGAPPREWARALPLTIPGGLLVWKDLGEFTDLTSHRGGDLLEDVQRGCVGDRVADEDALPSAPDKAGLMEEPEVFRDVLVRCVEHVGQLLDRRLAVLQKIQELDPRWVGDDAKSVSEDLDERIGERVRVRHRAKTVRNRTVLYARSFASLDLAGRSATLRAMYGGRKPRAEAADRILNSADELFYERGIASVGVDAIVARSGVSKATLYRHFSSKEELLAA